jgi:hypothetical protein
MFCSSHDFPGFSIFHTTPRCNLLPQPLTIPPTPNHRTIPGSTTTASAVQSFEVSRQLEIDQKLILLSQLTHKISFFSAAAIAAIFCHGHRPSPDKKIG